MGIVPRAGRPDGQAVPGLHPRHGHGPIFAPARCSPTTCYQPNCVQHINTLIPHNPFSCGRHPLRLSLSSRLCPLPSSFPHVSAQAALLPDSLLFSPAPRLGTRGGLCYEWRSQAPLGPSLRPRGAAAVGVRARSRRTCHRPPLSWGCGHEARSPPLAAAVGARPRGALATTPPVKKFM